MLITENLAIVIFGIILIVAVIVAFYMKTYQRYDISMFHTFVAVLSGLGVFVTFMFYYSVISLQNQQEQIGIMQEVSRLTSEDINSVLNEISNSKDIIPNFILSLMPLNSYNMKIEDDPNIPNVHISKFILSNKIFSIWQNILLTKNIIRLDEVTYIAKFLQYANSKQLHEMWLNNHISYNSKTKVFGNLLFEYSLSNKCVNCNEYDKLASKLISDERYIKLN